MNKHNKEKKVSKEVTIKPEYSRPIVEDLELDENIAPEMAFTARSGMGNCKHTYIPS